MCMIDPRDLTTSEKTTIDRLLQDVPKYKQRIAGKSLPMEKFACKRSERYFLTGMLVIPAIGEMLRLMDYFHLPNCVFPTRTDVFVESVQNYGQALPTGG